MERRGGNHGGRDVAAAIISRTTIHNYQGLSLSLSLAIYLLGEKMK